MNDSSNDSKIALGKDLFNDVRLSGNRKISCATCHRPEKAFTDGLPRSLAFNGRDHLKRNAPTLINASLQAALFYDSRVAYLEDQANEVILSKDEMHGSLEKALVAINEEARYKNLITSTYQDRQVTAYHLKNAIASYLRSLVMLNSRFDLYMRGNRKALNAEEIDGFNVFMGKAKCGTCHFIPLFNGTVPPLYNKSESEIIGVPATADTVNTFHDEDEGKYRLFKIPLQKHSFKTPGLRNVSLTAPYMHNGVFKTLEEVIEFYNRGGGAGLGLKIDHLTLPEDKLHLTGKEKTNLIAFLGALTDTTARR